MMRAEPVDLDSIHENWSDDDDVSYRGYCSILQGEFGRHIPAPQFVTPVEARWLEYLRSLEARQLTSGEVARAAESLWSQMSDAVVGITPPNANPLEDGGIRFSWNAPGKYMQIEIGHNARDMEWFYRDTPAQVSDFGEGTLESAASSQLTNRLSSMF